jgi:hypothetical protein
MDRNSLWGGWKGGFCPLELQPDQVRRRIQRGEVDSCKRLSFALGFFITK